jgi:hypothetical protein
MNSRHDLYRLIHKALRAAMFDTVLRLGRVDAGDDAALGEALDQAQQLLALVASHVKHENDFVHCAIEARRPGGAGATADEHRDHLDALHALNLEVAALRQAPAAERPLLLHRLYRHLAHFTADQLLHMHREESQNNEALWTLYSDIELTALHRRLLASVEPHTLQQAQHWMARALNPQELAGSAA